MASVYRRTYTRDGKKVKADHYTVAYVNAKGRRDYARGFRDKRSSELLGLKLEDEARKVRLGLAAEEAAQGHNLEDLRARWLGELERQHRGLDYLGVAGRVTQRLLDSPRRHGLGAEKLSDLDPGRYAEWSAREARRNRWSDRTVNSYLEVARTWLRWCVARGLLPYDPLATVTKVQKPKKVRPRRAFTPEELKRFLASVPEVHARIYRAAALSGLRRKEVRLLEVRDVDVAKGLWRLRAESTKARRADTVPMLPEARDLMRPLIGGREGHERVWPKVPLSRVFKRQLEAIGLAGADARGRRLGFHSLRYTFCTELARRLPVQRVRQLMRHSTIKLTFDLYADLGLDDLWDQVQDLPRILEG